MRWRRCCAVCRVLQHRHRWLWRINLPDAGPLLMLTPWQALLMASALMLLALRRGWQGWQIVRYQRNLLRLPRYALTSRKIPVSPSGCFSVKAFAGCLSTPSVCTTACNRKPRAGCAGMVLPSGKTIENAASILCPGLPTAQRRSLAEPNTSAATRRRQSVVARCRG